MATRSRKIEPDAVAKTYVELTVAVVTLQEQIENLTKGVELLLTAVDHFLALAYDAEPDDNNAH